MITMNLGDLRNKASPSLGIDLNLSPQAVYHDLVIFYLILDLWRSCHAGGL